jgi:hypothetical protein
MRRRVEACSNSVKGVHGHAGAMANVVSGQERRSRSTNRKKEANPTPSSKRRGERQKQPNAEPIQGRGVKRQNTRNTRERARVKG